MSTQHSADADPQPVNDIARECIAGMSDETLVALHALFRSVAESGIEAAKVTAQEYLAAVAGVMAERGIEAADDAQADTGADR